MIIVLKKRRAVMMRKLMEISYETIPQGTLITRCVRYLRRDLLEGQFKVIREEERVERYEVRDS